MNNKKRGVYFKKDTRIPKHNKMQGNNNNLLQQTKKKLIKGAKLKLLIRAEN